VSLRGRLEAQIYQSSSWAPTATGTLSAAATVAASSTRYPTTLCSAFATALSTATSDTVTVTPSFGESGTGLVTIASTANLAINWGAATDLRDLLGFTGNLSAATSHVGTLSCKGVWLPECILAHSRGSADTGVYEAVMPQTVSPTGAVKTLMGSVRVRLPMIVWSLVPKAKALRSADSSGASMSFERWWYQTQASGLGYFKAGSTVNVYTDAATPTLLGDYKLLWPNGGPNLERADEGWDGLWRCWIEGYEVS
jgi:hypothetical protein